MGFEEIEVRITKRGEIFVKVEGAREERLRDYFAFLEETIGPVQSEAADRRDWESPAGIDAETDEEQRRREQEVQG